MSNQSGYVTSTGTGPGTQTPDGCSVELYRRTPYRGELEGLRALLQEKRILELGCGTGRLTSKLLEMSCQVTAVDNSTEMLAILPPNVESVLANIETLNLEPRFDIALLASYIYNKPDSNTRSRYAATAKRTTKVGGSFMLQVNSEEMFDGIEIGRESEADGITMRVTSHTTKDKCVSMSIQYSIGELEWTHAFTTKILTLTEIQQELMAEGFSSIEWVDQPRGWILAA